MMGNAFGSDRSHPPNHATVRAWQVLSLLHTEKNAPRGVLFLSETLRFEVERRPDLGNDAVDANRDRWIPSILFQTP
jgi:hypothetical protein